MSLILEPVNIKACSECGDQRGGVLDLRGRKPVFRCFNCNEEHERLVRNKGVATEGLPTPAFTSQFALRGIVSHNLR